MPKTPNLSNVDMSALATAVEMANDWRGSQVGNPDPEPLRAFDAGIARMRAALAKVKHLRREVKALRAVTGSASVTCITKAPK